MITMKARDVERSLVDKLGFEKTESHHHIYRLWLDGQMVARTFISHGERELSRFHIGSMAKQMRLSQAQFADAVNCPLSQETYYRLLRERMSED